MDGLARCSASESLSRGSSMAEQAAACEAWKGVSHITADTLYHARGNLWGNGFDRPNENGPRMHGA
jgi:hypothetical protein